MAQLVGLGPRKLKLRGLPRVLTSRKRTLPVVWSHIMVCLAAKLWPYSGLVL